VFDVIGVGANAFDRVYRIPTHPAARGPDSKLKILRQFESPGGQVATALATCARLGLAAKYVGTFGNDTNGAFMRASLRERKIDLSSAVTRATPHPCAVILIDDRTGERVVLWDRSEAFRLTDAELDAGMAPARVVHVDDVDPRAALRAARHARAARALVTTDLERVTDETEELIRLATHPILGEDLPRALTGEFDLERALRSLRAWTEAPIIATRGGRGAMALVEDQVVESPGVAVNTVDTTGAGDVFRGAFIRALIDGLPMERMLRFANAAAAVSCTRDGAIPAVPRMEDIEPLL
jgi:sugar/nucleoside kinase (ribokinase family)